MATTSPDNLRTPDPGDPYNLVPDLATLSGDVQTALNKRSVTSGTVAQRTAFTTSATDGWLWQDTDGIKMIWRKDGAVWVPAVWRWSGSNTQMTAFAAPNGFEWFNLTNGNTYLRVGGAWRISFGVLANGISTGQTSSLSNSTGAFLDLGGAAGLSVNVLVPTSTQVKVTVQGGLISTSPGLQITTRLSGATTETPVLDSFGTVKAVASSDVIAQASRVVTLSPGTTTFTVVYRGGGAIRNTGILVEAV